MRFNLDGAGNMIGKRVREISGRVVTNTMTWSAENRLLAQTNDKGLVFYNPSLVEKDGKDQNTWATDRTWLNNKYVSRAYDHQSRHVLWEGDAANPEARYILGPNRDEILASAVKMGGGVVRSYTYQNFRQDVLSVQSANALYSSTRKYLPTGLAITDGQSPGNPGRGRNPPNPNPYSPPPPLPFGWQGKERIQQYSYDFDNREFTSSGYISSDPLIEANAFPLGAYRYVDFSRNSLIHTDPSGLYSIKLCSTSHQALIKAAMPSVYAASDSWCVYGKDRRGKLRHLYKSSLQISCGHDLWATDAKHGGAIGRAVPGVPQLQIDLSRIKNSGKHLGYDGGFTIDFGSYSGKISSTIFHEMIHIIGAGREVWPTQCECRCANKLGNTCSRPEVACKP